MSHPFQLPRLLRLEKTDNLSIPNQVLEVSQLARQHIRCLIDLVKKNMSWVVLLSAKHLLHVCHHQSFMRRREKQDPICGLVERCHRRVIVLVGLNRFHKTLQTLINSAPSTLIHPGTPT